MKITGNCRPKGSWCPFLRSPVYHSGFTGKSGPETWWQCLKFKKYTRNIGACPIAGNPEEQREAWIEQEAKS